jgi:hypothetical protein
MTSTSTFDFNSGTTCPIGEDVDYPVSAAYIVVGLLFMGTVCALLYTRLVAPVIGRAIAATMELLVDDPSIRRGRRNTTPNLLIKALGEHTPVRSVLRKSYNTETVHFADPVRSSAVVFPLSDKNVALMRDVALTGKVFSVCCDASMNEGTSLHYVMCVRQRDQAVVAHTFGCAMTTTIGHRVTDKTGKSVLRGIYTSPGADPVEFGTHALPWQGIGSTVGRTKTFGGEEIAPKMMADVAANDEMLFWKRPFHYYQILVVSDDFEYDTN